MDEVYVKTEETEIFFQVHNKNSVESDPLSMDEEERIEIKEEIDSKMGIRLSEIGVEEFHLDCKVEQAVSEDIFEISEQKTQVKDEYEQQKHFQFYEEDSSEIQTNCTRGEKISDSEINIIDIDEKHLITSDSESEEPGEEKYCTSYTCKTCNKIFPTKCRLVRHEVVHTGKRPYQCEICKKSYPYNSGLKRHYRTHSDNSVYQCKVCKKLFINKSSLDLHLQSHSTSKPLECNICMKPFFSKHTLRAHLLTHERGKHHSCEKCGKTFINKGNLTKHIRIQNCVPLFKCNVCKKSFYRKINLTLHSRPHRGERPYSCVFCKKNFSSKCHLNVHMKSHATRHNKSFGMEEISTSHTDISI